MDPSTLVPLLTPLITAAAHYLKNQAAQKVGEKAAEVIGEKAGEAIVNTGPKTLDTLRSWFKKKEDLKAEQALELVEQNPDDIDYQQKLVKETARISVTDPTFEQELKILAGTAVVAQPGSNVQTINNQSSNEGAQGIFNDVVNFNRNT